MIELTPNEYESMKKYKDSYKICVVTKEVSGFFEKIGRKTELT